MQDLPTTPPRRRRWVFPIAALICTAGALGGCSGKKAQQTAPTTHSDVPASAPSVRGSENGMEMMWWGVSAGSRNIAELLAPYLEDTAGLDPRTRTLWQTNGLRLVCVPIERLDAIRQLLPQTGGVQRQWLGQVPLWTDVIHGSAWHDLQPVDMDNGRLNLGPGKVRILMRCWSMPLPAAEGADEIRAAMRAELLIQHQEPPRVDVADLYTRPTTVSDPLDEGLLFRRLAASIILPPDRALLIIPESPQVDWRSMAQIPPEQLNQDHAALTETRNDTPYSGPPEGEGDTTGGVGQVFRERAARREEEQRRSPALELSGPADPNAEFSRTLGELLLTPNRVRLEAGVADRPIIRSIVVLVPRIPERFSIELPAPTK